MKCDLNGEYWEGYYFARSMILSVEYGSRLFFADTFGIYPLLEEEVESLCIG